MKHTSIFRAQEGSALIYMVMIFAAVSAITAGMLQRSRLEILGTERFTNELQTTEYAYGAETFARQLLVEDGLKKNRQHQWGTAKFPAAITDGAVTLTIEDWSGRFNINSLLTGDQLAENRFYTLCTIMGMEDNAVESVLARVRQLYATTTDESEAAKPPRWFLHPSELMDYGLSQANYELIAPYLYAISSEAMIINVNAASEPVLNAYLSNKTQITSLYDLIHEEGYADNEGLVSIAIVNKDLKTESFIFNVRTTVKLGEKEMHSSTLMQRNIDKSGNVTVTTLARSWE